MPTPTPLQTFFAPYTSPTFTYTPTSPASSEFHRLAASRGWSPKNKPYKRARRAFQNALVEEFNARFGRDEGRMEGWRAICAAVGVREVPGSVTQAKKILAHIHINLVDLTESRILNRPPQIFRTIAALRRYTLADETRIFPREHAKAGGLLRCFLRPIGSNNW